MAADQGGRVSGCLVPLPTAARTSDEAMVAEQRLGAVILVVDDDPEIRDVVLKAFPQATITFRVDDKRQMIVDSWPADVDDSAARADWGFSPAHDFERAFSEYLIPTIKKRYEKLQ